MTSIALSFTILCLSSKYYYYNKYYHKLLLAGLTVIIENSNYAVQRNFNPFAVENFHRTLQACQHYMVNFIGKNMNKCC